MMERAYHRYRCSYCGTLYDEEQGAPEDGILPGTRFEDIPEDWFCPHCGSLKSDFQLCPE